LGETNPIHGYFLGQRNLEGWVCAHGL